MGAIYVSLTALILAISVKTLGNGMISALLPLDIAARGMGASAAGAVATGYGAGFLVGCLFAPALVRRAGHIRVFSAFSAIFCALILAFPAFPDPIAWVGFRFLTGFSMAALSTVADGWVSARATPEIRGRVISIYMLVTKLSIMIGPALLTVMQVGEPWPYMLAAALFALAVVPVALSTAAAPAVPSPERLTLRQLYTIAPASVVGCLGIGMLNGALLGLIPLYGAQLDLGTRNAALLVSAMHGGSLLLQWPIGWLSDKRDRRLVIVGVTVVTASVSIALAVLSALPLWGLFALVALWGGASLSLYAVCVAHASDMAQDERQIIPLCASLLLLWATGATVGPVVGSLAMEAMGPRGLFAYASIVAVLMAAFIAWRIRARPATKEAGQQPFVNMPASSPTMATLDPRAPDDQVVAEDPPPVK